MPPPPRRKTKAARQPWLSIDSIQLIDRRCALRRDPFHNRTIARHLDQQIKSSIKADRKRRTEAAGQGIAAALARDPSEAQKEAYKIAKKWY
jgi:hypothetical protein